MALTPQEIDEKLAMLEEPEEPQEEVEVEPEEEEFEEVEDSDTSPDDTDDEEPAESAGDDEEEEEVELTKEETGLLEATKAERRKRQEAEEKLENIQKTLESLQETVTNSQAPKTLDEAYARDPKGVQDNINVNIQAAVDAGDALEAERLRDLKETLRENKRQSEINQQQTTTKQTEIVTLLNSQVPGFLTPKGQIDVDKAQELTAFAIEKLGYTDEDLTERTNIPKHGVAAVKEIARINAVFEKSKVPGKAKKKKVKKATTVEKSGKPSQKKVASESKLIEEARATGDWSKVLDSRFG